MKRDIAVEMWRAASVVALKNMQIGDSIHAPLDNFIQTYIDSVEHVSCKHEMEQVDFAVKLGFGTIVKFFDGLQVLSGEGASKKPENSDGETINSVISEMGLVEYVTANGSKVFLPKKTEKVG